MANDDKIFELMTQMYSEMQGTFTRVRGEMQSGFATINDRLDNVENEVKKTNLVIENVIEPKIEALFDGYKQNSEKLTRIETEVIKHEEFI